MGKDRKQQNSTVNWSEQNKEAEKYKTVAARKVNEPGPLQFWLSQVRDNIMNNNNNAK